MSVGLLAISRQKIRPARAHVARHVLHDEGDAVRLGVNRAEELLVVQLLNRPVGEPLQSAELPDDVFEVVLCKRVCHVKYSPPKRISFTAYGSGTDFNPFAPSVP